MENILSLDTILNEEIVSFNDVANIFGDAEEMDCVEGNNSGEGVMYSISFNIGIKDVTVHMKVNTIPSYDFGLTTMGELSISNMGNHPFFSTAKHH